MAVVLDHAQLFNFEGRPAVLVSQPYGVTPRGLRHLWELASLEGFEGGIGAEHQQTLT